VTVATETRQVSYTGAPATLDHPVPFPFQENDQLVVTETVDDVTTLLVEGDDYEVSGGGGEIGTVTFLEPPTDGSTITIKREVPYLQETDLQPQGNYSAVTHENALDYAMYCIQQLNDRVAALEASSTLGTIADYSVLVLDLDFTASADPEDSFPQTVAVPAGFTVEAAWIGKPANSGDPTDPLQTTPQLGAFEQDGTDLNLNHISGLEGGESYSFVILVLGTQA
jgi:hypothetical protein